MIKTINNKTMKVRSKRKVILCQDREGTVEEFIQINISVMKKDDELKEYLIETKDYIVLNAGTGNEILSAVKNRYGDSQTKLYHKTYLEYDTEREQLIQLFPSELTGSELDDYLLVSGLLYSLEVNPIYGLTGSEWTSNINPQPVVVEETQE